MTKPTIGFIGLGLMGGNMVENLQKRGYQLTVLDLNKTAVSACVARGANVATSAKKLAATSDIIMLCLTTSAVVESLVYADDGILAGIKPGRKCRCQQMYHPTAASRNRHWRGRGQKGWEYSGPGHEWQ